MTTYVYACYAEDGRLLYVGCSGQPRTRIAVHRRRSWWGQQIARVELTAYPTRQDALAAERDAIRRLEPVGNTSLTSRDRGAAVPGPPAPCGTYAGYQRHHRHSDPACSECRRALRDYVRAYRARRSASRDTSTAPLAVAS